VAHARILGRRQTRKCVTRIQQNWRFCVRGYVADSGKKRSLRFTSVAQAGVLPPMGRPDAMVGGGGKHCKLSGILRFCGAAQTLHARPPARRCQTRSCVVL